MGRYDNNNDDYVNSNTRQRDLVLAANEFAFVMTKTNGAIRTYSGPIMLTISQQESLVIFNNTTKRFEDTSDFNKAKQLFVSAPEGWYVVLKNPAKDGTHPEQGKAVNSPELNIGRKINIAGPCSFSLFPGQMAKVVRGHRLRSNQYLIARVYDAAAAEEGRKSATIIDNEGKEVKTEDDTKYYAGQLLVIKGTEVSFYMPPTGIEVIADAATHDYVREAVTLERLEYAILKDEDGEKRYVHGPAVVFPKPTETFVETEKGSTIFRALELSPISGIYVKVIAPYDEKNSKGETIHHKTGEELFITGKEQMIYYPRPEHALIQYDGKYMHHAIAIPEGEGRYIMNRLTGEIKTVVGPKMYLPDPRTEVVVRRKLTQKECELFYPGNSDVLAYNTAMTEQKVERNARTAAATDALSLNGMSTMDTVKSLAIFEANAKISRGTSYTKPRTIMLDTKYDGAVEVNVWTGYAINVVSKTGKRDTVIGPASRLLDYDETLEAVSLSTGTPKRADKLIDTAYLRIENNKVSDIVSVQTKDFVNVNIKLSYCVNFLQEYKDKWFSIENYVKYLCDRMRSLLKQEVKKHDIEEFNTNLYEIVRGVCLDTKAVATTTRNGKTTSQVVVDGRVFTENGMKVTDVEVLGVEMDKKVAELLNKHQTEIFTKSLELSNAKARMAVVTQLAEYRKQEEQLNYENNMAELKLRQEHDLADLENRKILSEKKYEIEKASREADASLQPVLDTINAAQLAREKNAEEQHLAQERAAAEIEKAKQEAYANAVAIVMQAISPDLAASLSDKANKEILEGLSKAIAPYSMAKNESIAESISTLLRGTSLEQTLKNVGAANQ